MKHEWRRVQLGERDYEILAGIEKCGILGLAQLEGVVFKKGTDWNERIRLFFNEAGREIYTKACYKRLSDLEAAGYVRSQFYLNHRKLYTLTAEGHEALILAGKAKLPGYRRGMSEALISHEIAVNGVGFILSELHGLTVRTERQIEAQLHGRDTKKGHQQLPDLYVADKEHPKAIEVELIQKSEHRYKEIFSRYLHLLGYKASVAYITGWPKGAELIHKLAKKHSANWVYAASLAEFKASRGRCQFIGAYPVGASSYGAIRLAPDDMPQLPAEPKPEPILKAMSAAPRVQEAPPKASLDAPQVKEVDPWSGGYKPNPYAHLPPYQRPPEYRY